MPGFMPALDVSFGMEADKSIGIAQLAESLCLPLADGKYKTLHHSRVEYIYEVAFLRMFIAWESFLEGVFLRYLCGKCSKKNGVIALASGNPHHSSISDAADEMLSQKPYTDYVLWGQTRHAIKVSQMYLVNGPHETVIQSARTRLDYFSAVRNRVAHGQKDQKVKFDDATLNLTLKKYPGSSAGKFLRDWNKSVSPPTRWLRSIGDELKGLAQLVV